MNYHEWLRVHVDEKVAHQIRAFHQKGNFTFDPLINHRLNVEWPSDLMSRLGDETKITAGKAAVDCKTSNSETARHAPLRTQSSDAFAQDRPIPLEHVHDLLNKSFAAQPDRFPRRPYASAGMAYPVEVFAALLGSKLAPEAQSGIYHYLPCSQKLELVKPLSEETILAYARGPTSNDALKPAVILFYVLHVQLATIKYRYKGYRFALMEVGSMYHQADLVAQSLGMVNRMWGGCGESEFLKLAGLSPILFLPATAQLFGWPETKGQDDE